MATPAEIAQAIKGKFENAVLEINIENTKMPHVVVDAAKILDVCKFARENADLNFDFLAAIAGVDKGEKLEVVYIMHSIGKKHSFAIKARVPRADPKIKSVTGVWKAADWHERETFDLVGIIFEGHPDLRRLLLPDDWVGHPLRKDYKYPKSYDGIDLRRDEKGWEDPGDKGLYE